MMRINYRTLPAVVLASGLVAATACNINDELLSPQQPGVIGAGDVQSATGAEALRVGALQQLSAVTGGGTSMWASAGTLADEWKSGDTFFQTDETDRRTIPTNNSQVSGQYSNAQVARGHAMTAIAALKQYSPEKTANIGQMYFALGFIEMNISEFFCNGTPFGFTDNGTPVYTKPVTNVEGFTLALARIDSGLTSVGNPPASDAFATSIKNALLITKARILIDLARWSDAAPLVASVPTSYTYNLTFSTTAGDNGPYSMNGIGASSRYVVSDSFDFFNGQLNVVKNALPFASAKDPRLPVTGSSTATAKAIDAYTPFVGTVVWSDRSAPVPLVTGIDARLIEAETKLRADDIAGMMTILNALRMAPQKLGKLDVAAMAALPTPTSKDAAISLFFREKAFWTFGRGQRLGDLRRLIRQYGRAQEDVFPVGNYFKSGVYGTDVNLPVTDNEITNPNFHGCLDRKARGADMRIRLFAIVTAGIIPMVATAQQIVVGPNVQISGARAKDAHSEPVIAADPNHPERLIAASHIAYHDTVGTKSIAYVSFDTGKTWTISLDRRDSTITADAAVAYGVDGSAYFATLARWGMYRSRDGGKTWDPPTKTPPAYGWDREYLVADFSPGKYRGRVYMNSTVSVPWVSDTSGPGFGGGQKENAIALFTSTDGGSTYGNPILRLVPRPEGILGMSNSVVLSDGTLMSLYGHRKPAPNGPGGGARGGLAARTPLPAANYWLDVITSTDGGESWNPATHVADYWMNRPRSEGAVIPDLAVDPGSPHFKDRLYVVWSDFRSGRLEVMLSYSSDKGKTWSREQIINDDRANPDPLVNGPDNVTPVVAVNKDGVVAVAWYDRRDFEDNISWNIRMRASLDGGETWTPSVKITDKPSQFGGPTESWYAQAGGGGGGGRGGRGGADTARSGGAMVSLSGRLSFANFTFAPGHNGAFVADAAGGFHPAWIDYRNGMAQLWTTTVWVKGPVAVNGGGGLEGMSNLSSRLALETISTNYDRQTNRLTFKTRLKNLSKTDTARGPLKARVLVLTSENAKTIEIANSDNQVRGVGAILDFTPQLKGGMLLPDSLSAPRDIVFQLGGIGRFREGTDLRLGFVTMDAKILGPPMRMRPNTRAASSGDKP